jgi:putative spermidine/putrescine transport system substrate-binding protein
MRNRNPKQPKSKNRSNISRRKFLATSVKVVASVAAMGPFIILPRKSMASEKLVVVSWGGRYRENIETAFVKPFTKETGIEVMVTDQPDFAKVKAQVMSGNVEWDVLDTMGWSAKNGEKEGLWEPIDTSLVDTTDMVFPISKSTVPFYSGAGVIAWDPSRHPKGKHPVNFKDLWNVDKFPGRRMFRTRPYETLELALVADGVDPSKLYPLDVDRAFKSLDRIKPYVVKWVKATPQTISLLQNNEIDFSYTYNGRVSMAKKSGMSIDMSLEQCFLAKEYLVVMKGTKKKEAAMKYINFCLRPDRQAHWAKLSAYMPTKTKSYSLIPEEIMKYLADPKNPNHIVADDNWWRDNLAEVTERYKEWILQ